MKEQYLQKKIIDYLESLGWIVIKIISANKAGWPDLICCDTKGQFICFEIKLPDGKVSELQLYRIAQIQKIGRAYVVRSVEEVKAIAENKT